MSEDCHTSVLPRMHTDQFLRTYVVTSSSLCCPRDTSRQRERVPRLSAHASSFLSSAVPRDLPPPLPQNVDLEAPFCSCTMPEDDYLCDEEVFVAEYDGEIAVIEEE